jgi:hypothetical protein
MTIQPPKSRPQIVIRQHGPMFTMNPPTSAMAAMLTGPEADVHRQKVLPTISEAMGQAVALACSYDWGIVDETGTVDQDGVAKLIAAHKAGII